MWDQETGLYNAKARYFDPKLGRFLTQDSYLGQIDDPPSLHRYFYANANPTAFVDQDGHSATAVGAVVGFAWGVGQAIGGFVNDRIIEGNKRPVAEYFARAGSTIAQNTIGGAELGLAVDATVLSGGTAAVVGGAAGNAGLSGLTFGGQAESWSDFGLAQAQDAAVGGVLGGVLAKAAPFVGRAAGWVGEQVPIFARGGQALVAGGRRLAGAIGEAGKGAAARYEGGRLGSTLADVANPLQRFAPKPATAGTNTAVSIVEGEGGASGGISVKPAAESVPPASNPQATTFRDSAGRLRNPNGTFAKDPARSASGSGTRYDRGSIIKKSKSTNDQVLVRDPDCQYCQLRQSEDVDHIVSGYEGDSLVGAGILTQDEAIALINDLDNLLGACPACNRGKGATLPGNTPGTWLPSNPSAKAIELMRKLGTWKD